MKSRKLGSKVEEEKEKVSGQDEAEVEEELVLVSSPVDAGISCWGLRSKREHLRHRSCASAPHSLVPVARRFIASSQLRGPSSSSGSILYWSWNKAQPEVKSFPSEPINPLVCNREGTYLFGGGSSGKIFLWEVASGTLLKKWDAHYRAVTCLVLSDDESLLISGAEDGFVRVWSLIKLFDDAKDPMGKHLYERSFSEHTLRVTDLLCGSGGCSSIIVSSSEDRTCKVWSLSKGRLLRSIVFPLIINSIALDPGEHVFYAGCSDGKIYIAALNTESSSCSSYGMHIIGALSDNSKAITCLAFSMDGISLVSGSDDGTVRVWNTITRSILHYFNHTKGPINNILVLTKPLSPCQTKMHGQGSGSRRHSSSLLPPSLDKYIDSDGGIVDTRPVKALKLFQNEPFDCQYLTSHVMTYQIRDIQQQGSSASLEMELERWKLNCRRFLKVSQQRQDLLQACINELLDGTQTGDA